MHVTTIRAYLPSPPQFMRRCSDRLTQKVQSATIPILRQAIRNELAIPSVISGVSTVSCSIISRSYSGSLSLEAQVAVIAGASLFTAGATFFVFIKKGFPFLVRTCLNKALQQRDYEWIESVMKDEDITYYDFLEKDGAGDTFLHKLLRHPLSAGQLRCVYSFWKEKSKNLEVINHAGEKPLNLAFCLPRSPLENICPVRFLLSLGASFRKSGLINRIGIDDLIVLLKSSTIIVDPESPFYPIFEELEKLRKEIPGGMETLLRPELTMYHKGTYRYDPETRSIIHTAPLMNLWGSICMTLLTLQELKSEVYQSLIRQHDNRLNINENKASQLIFSVTGMIVHLDLGDHTKIEAACDLVLFWFHKAQQANTLLDFFLQGFNQNNECFEGRMAHFQKYVAPDDFTENFVPNHSTATKLGEYFRVFRNRQLKEMVGQEYASLVGKMQKGTMPANLAVIFYTEFCTHQKFVQYVENYCANQDPEIVATAREDGLGFFA